MFFIWLLLFAIAIVFLLFLPLLIRVTYKRLQLRKKLRAVCKARGFGLVPTRKLWFFGRTTGRVCDVYLFTDKKVYAVKLIGTVSKNIHFRFLDETHFATRNLLYLIGFGTASVVCKRPIQYKIKNKRPYDFKSHFDAPCDAQQEPIPVILMNPVSGKVSIVRGNNEERVWNGDFTGEGYFYNLSGFLQRIEKEA